MEGSEGNNIDEIAGGNVYILLLLSACCSEKCGILHLYLGIISAFSHNHIKPHLAPQNMIKLSNKRQTPISPLTVLIFYLCFIINAVFMFI
jgi:hypothetical protein